jgi:hypothetical protein
VMPMQGERMEKEEASDGYAWMKTREEGIRNR